MGKKSAVDMAYEKGYEEGIDAGKKHVKALRARQEQEAFNRGVQRGQQLTEAAKAGGILDLQTQLDAMRAEALHYKQQRNGVVMAVVHELLK